MLERVRNLIKQDRKKSRTKDASHATSDSTPKCSRQKMDTMIRRYPVVISRSDSVLDKDTISWHMQALSQEMLKTKPRERIVLPLMKNTFSTRWIFVTKEAKSIKEILQKYPALKFPTVVS